MPKSFMVKNSKRWIPSRESREKEMRTAIAIGMFLSFLITSLMFDKNCLTVFYSNKFFYILNEETNLASVDHSKII